MARLHPLYTILVVLAAVLAYWAWPSKPGAAAAVGIVNATAIRAIEAVGPAGVAATTVCIVVVLAGVLVRSRLALPSNATPVQEGVETAAIRAAGGMAVSGLRFAGQTSVSLGSDVSGAMRDLKVTSQASTEGKASWSTWFSSSKAELEQHDMVIDLEDLGAITDGERGWPICVRNEAVYNRLLDCSTLKVAVIGMYNRGKTYILSQLAGAQLEHGRLVHTVGLSVVLNKANTILFMDTAGENRAVVVDSKTEEEAETEIRRRVLGVQFLQEIVLEIADLVIVVVNQLTLEDQRYVAKVAKKLKLCNSKQEKQMIVVHNFKDTMCEQDLAELEQKDIQSACGAVREGSTAWWKTERYNALHVSMASTHSPYGAKLNLKSLDWVNDFLKYRIPMMHNNVLAKSFMEKFVEVSRKWLPVFFTGLTPEDLKDKLCLKLSLLSQPKYIFHIGPDCAAELREDLRVWDWEHSNHYKAYELAYEVFQCKDETRVHVEIPGVFREDPLNTEAVILKTAPIDPFRAKFTWMENDKQVLSVSVTMAANKQIAPGVVIDAYRHQTADDMPKAQHYGTSVENKGKAQLKIHFTDIHGPMQFVEPSATVHRNGLLIVTLKHANSEEELQVP